MASAHKQSIPRVVIVALALLIAVAAIQVDPVEGFMQDLMFVKGKFIKQDRRGVIVVEDEKCKCKCCHGGK